MPVFDCHVHIGLPEQIPDEVEAFQRAFAPRHVAAPERSADPAALRRYLKGQGVDRAIVLPSWIGPDGEGPNDWVAGFAASDPELFVPFASVHPVRDPGAAEELERCVKDLGSRGLKLSPVDQHFDPSDERAYAVYQTALRLGVPILTHTGTSMFRNARVRYASPLLWDDVAVSLPELKIVLAHAGMGLFYDEAQWMCRRHANVYLDISALPPKRLPQRLPDLEGLAVAGKVLFGSDWPGVPKDIAENIRAVRALPYADRAIEAILWDNARALFD